MLQLRVLQLKGFDNGGYYYPNTDGAAGDILTTDGAGIASWTAVSGIVGPTGPAGPTGAQGPTGANGNDGADGATGAQGPTERMVMMVLME